MRSCAGTGAAPATPRSVYSPPAPGTSVSKRRYGTGSDVCVRAAHGVAWSGRRSTRNGSSPSASTQRTDDVGVPALERRDLLVDRALVAGFVGGLDVQEEEVAVGERRERGVALRDVVVVEAGGRAGDVEHLDAREHAEAAHEVDGRRQPAARRRSASVKSGSCGRVPWPHSQIWVAIESTSAAAARDDRLRRVHQRDELGRGGTGRQHDRAGR